ncbi:MAG: cupin domain-containing protein [Rubrivivax sp.]
MRGRLMQRLAASRAAEAVMHTVRRRRAPRQSPVPGVQLQPLYVAAADGAHRRGEPLRAQLIELAPGARLDTAPLGALGAAGHREWLVLSGRVQLDAEELGQRDYHVRPAGTPPPVLSSAQGALVFMRECELPAQGEAAHTVRDADAGWPDYAPGIRRRVLWTRQGQAALLYHAQPGASVPLHSHGHDEECLMVQGELFLDDLLLQPGDYQLAPQGSSHRITETDTGVVIYAHGDLDLQFR